MQTDGRTDCRRDGETNRWIGGETDVKKLILFFAIFRTRLKSSSNCLLLQIYMVHVVVSLEIRLDVSKGTKITSLFFFHRSKKKLFAVLGARFKIRRICLLPTQCVYMFVMIL